VSRREEAGRHDASRATAGALGVKADELEERLADAEAIKAAWLELEPAERAVLDALTELGGAAPASQVGGEVAADAEEGLDAGLSGDPGEAASDAAEALDALWTRGLVQRDRGTRDVWLLPSLGVALGRRLKAELADTLSRVEPPPQPDPDEHLLLCAHAILRREPMGLTKTGRPHRRALLALAEALSALLPAGAGTAAAEDLVKELRRQGLLRLVQGELRTDEETSTDWAEAGRRERAARMLRSEWANADAPLLLRQLRVLPEARWPFARARRSLRRLLWRKGGEEASLVADRIGSRFEGAIATLRSAGLVRIDSDRKSVALTALGRSWPEPAVEAPGPTGMHVGNDLAVLVPRGLTPPVHLRLSRAAQLEAGDVVARYRLERSALLEALDGGEHPDEFLAFLEARAEPRLPATVREDIKRWGERFGEVTAHEGIAVTCRVQVRREEFAALVARSSLGVQLIAPGVAIVTPHDHQTFLEELAAASFTPRRRVLPAAPGRGRGLLAGQALPSQRSAPEASLEWASLPSWDAPAEGGRGRRATPPPDQALARLKEKYRREFGRSELAALDELEVDELLELEERGRIRRYLTGLEPSSGSSRDLVDLEEYEGRELVPTTPRRAAAVLERAANEDRRCELAWRGEGGTRVVSALQPLEVLTEAGIRYLRARAGDRGRERLVALDRILGVRVISTRF
jgi:hypothetical protein